MNRREAVKQEVREYAARIVALGFRVFIAEAGHYGIITDKEGLRVVSFSFDGPWSSVSLNYGPPSAESGTGCRYSDAPWALKAREDVQKALDCMPPAFAGRGWKYMTTLAQHLKTYGESSRYTEVAA